VKFPERLDERGNDVHDPEPEMVYRIAGARDARPEEACQRSAAAELAPETAALVLSSRPNSDGFVIRSPFQRELAHLRHRNVRCLCRPKIDDQFEFRRLLDREIDRPRLAQNPVDQLGGAREKTCVPYSMGHQTGRTPAHAPAVARVGSSP
jgi:hypothetical protein